MIIETAVPDFTIREATEADVPTILAFIKGLAEYEKLSHEMVATEDLLHTALFGERPVAEVLFGCYQNEPVAFALFFQSFSTFLGKPGIYLEDLFVLPEMRGNGYGKTLLIYLAYLAKQRGYGRFEWTVLDWNEPAIRFYDSLGAKSMNEWIIRRVDGESLTELAAQFDSPSAE